MFDTLLDNVPSSDFKLAPTSRPDIPTPEQIVETVEVDGRHGSLTKLGKFKDISFNIEYNILEDMNIKPLLRKIKGYFFGKKTLKFTDDDVYYKIKSLKISETNNEIEQYGLFTVSFVCDPFQYELDHEIKLSKPSSIINRGTIESEPLITIFGNGNIELHVNGIPLYLIDVDGFISLDSALQDAYKNNTAKNYLMVGDFPIFELGENEIFWLGKVLAIVIEPRWRYI